MLRVRKAPTERDLNNNNNNIEDLWCVLTLSKGGSKRFTMTITLNRDKIQVMRICIVHDDENVTGATVEFS